MNEILQRFYFDQIIVSFFLKQRPSQIKIQPNFHYAMNQIHDQTQTQLEARNQNQIPSHPKLPSQSPQCERRSTHETLESELTSMSVECVLMVLEELNFHDLLDIAQTNQYLSILAADVFRRKLSSKTIEIVEPFAKGSLDQVRESSTQITLENFELVQLTFRIFGSEIRKFEFGFRKIAFELRRKIHKLINTHCAESLDSVFLNKCDADSLGNFMMPLKNVHHLTVKGELKSVKRALKMNEIFPNLQQLDLHDVNILDAEVLDVTFPQLTHLKVTISFLYDIYSYVEKIIKRNPQIQDLSLIYCNSFDYIRMASENLKNLGSLELNLELLSEEYDGPKIHFESVRQLKMNWGRFDFTDVLSFSELQSIHLSCYGGEGIEFAAQFPELTEFHLNQQELEGEDVLKLSDKLPNLKSLSISSPSEIDDEIIFKLIENSQKMEQLQLTTSSEQVYKALNGKFANKWTVTFDGDDIHMEKKGNES